MENDDIDSVFGMYDEHIKTCFCKICGERIDKKEFADKEAVYHKDVGAMHTKHKGVKEWYDEMLCIEQDKYIKRINDNKLEHEKMRMEKLAKEAKDKCDEILES